MRLSWLVLVTGLTAGLTLAACESATTTKPDPAGATSAATSAAAADQAQVVVPDSCGGACGGCGNMGSCNGSCGGQVAAQPVAEVPADAQWTMVHVAGMRCGGCARRIKTALAGVDGVLGVDVDVAKAEVRVAVAPGRDARALVTDPINQLGYQVLAN